MLINSYECDDVFSLNQSNLVDYRATCTCHSQLLDMVINLWYYNWKMYREKRIASMGVEGSTASYLLWDIFFVLTLDISPNVIWIYEFIGMGLYYMFNSSMQYQQTYKMFVLQVCYFVIISYVADMLYRSLFSTPFWTLGWACFALQI